MKNITLHADEFLSLYEGSLYENDIATVINTIEKVFGVKNVCVCKVPQYINLFKNYIKANRRDLKNAYDAIGGKFKTNKIGNQRTVEAFEHVCKFIREYGSNLISIEPIENKIESNSGLSC